MNGLGQNKVRTDAKRFGDAALTLYQSYRKRIFIEIRIPGALEQKSGVLLVIAVHHERVIVLIGDLFDRGKWLVANLDMEFQFVQNLADHAGCLLVRGK